MPDKLIGTEGYGLRGAEFCKRFPKLKYLLVRDRDLNLGGMILRNGSYEDRWKEESMVRQDIWNTEWRVVEEIFKARGVQIVVSSKMPEAENTRRALMATFPVHYISA
jgi:hypothetical protein